MKNKERVSAALLVLNAIDAWEKKYPPSYRELCDRTGISSTSTLKYCADKLATLGYIERDPATARSITRTTKEIDLSDFTIKEKGNAIHDASLQPRSEGAKGSKEVRHSQPRRMPRTDKGNLEGRRTDSREHGKDTNA